MSDKVKVEVKPQAWLDLYKILYRLMGEMGEWSAKHDLPVQITLGALGGLFDVISVTANACDCDDCNHVIDTFADELVSRMLDNGGTMH